MRLIAFVILIPFLVPSGCITGCTIYTRHAWWTQDNAPVPAGVDYQMGELWGGAGKDRNTGLIHVNVYKNDTVSHEELVEFANSLFASKGWPPPELERAQEESGCGDQY